MADETSGARVPERVWLWAEQDRGVEDWSAAIYGTADETVGRDLGTAEFVTLAHAEAMVAAERERAAKVCEDVARGWLAVARGLDRALKMDMADSVGGEVVKPLLEAAERIRALAQRKEKTDG